MQAEVAVPTEALRLRKVFNVEGDSLAGKEVRCGKVEFLSHVL